MTHLTDFPECASNSCLLYNLISCQVEIFKVFSEKWTFSNGKKTRPNTQMTCLADKKNKVVQQTN